jgi:hypothetical protein
MLDLDPNPVPVPLRQKVAVPVPVLQHCPTEKENKMAKTIVLIERLCVFYLDFLNLLLMSTMIRKIKFFSYMDVCGNFGSFHSLRSYGPPVMSSYKFINLSGFVLLFYGLVLRPLVL